ncbi:MAG: mannose-1-phosphate guanylyltransferase/mannose-6-phosphate isomerase [Gammaproteobacteria bacterium]|nr:mannose-1-phosphate guanylyltransferase/mannose-6-phosphate isomerase [Gammaproteobacteria bacterium]
MQIKPVILSGGSGTRLWPLSRQLFPKQLLPLVNHHTMLQDTAMRVKGATNMSPDVLVVCNEEHRFLVAEQLRSMNVPTDSIILEPVGKNTAPALTLAALALQNKDCSMLVMPADHVIQNTAAFHDAIKQAAKLAEQGYIATFGIVPARAETGYGYIEQGKAINEQAFQVARFVEKPDRTTAQGYLDAGTFLWNSGMFMLTPQTWLTHLSRLQPAMMQACEQAYCNGQADKDFYRLDKAAFATSPSDSIDYAVMEKLVATPEAKVAVVPLQAGWSDVGAWDALWDITNKDPAGNVVKGDVVNIGSQNSMLLSEGRLVAGVGLDSMVVVETADAVLVAHKDRVQDVKEVVTWLKAEGRDEHLTHRRVYRPWGSYEGIDVGERYQVKRITVNPQASLSLQMHHHRAEHWIVVKGTAKVTRDDEVFLVSENESTYIPIGTRHRLENPGTIPLEMIEVQSGSYLGEDDIVRFEDIYGREKEK